MTNYENCGSCGHACGAGTMCAGGSCVTSCPGTETACPATSPTYCADTTKDVNNCGSCGVVCPAGQVCTIAAGATTASCACPASAPDFCSSGDAGGLCTSKQTDPKNCGTCGNACAAGTMCAAGACVVTCPGTESACPATGTATYCADLTRDVNNCGGCGTACLQGQVCAIASGATTASCSCPTSAPDLCGSTCTNTMTDPANCGTCGTACGAGQTCQAGKCACGTGTSYCTAGSSGNGVAGCFDLQTDDYNCGSCGTTCATGQMCQAGTCACGTGTSYCTAATSGSGVAGCFDLQTDDSNCGACGTKCGAGQKCQTGACVETCSTSFTACPTSGTPTYCANLSSDPNNCGACGRVCPLGQTCGASTCACQAGTSYCTAAASGSGVAGCFDLQTDDSNCGACGKKCGAGQSCQSGTCAETCASGYTACPATGTATYCADTTSDNLNCGGCGNPSTGANICSAGVGGATVGNCVASTCTCPSGDAFCPLYGCETQTYNDLSCGSAATNCAGMTPPQVCVGSAGTACAAVPAPTGVSFYYPCAGCTSYMYPYEVAGDGTGTFYVGDYSQIAKCTSAGCGVAALYNLAAGQYTSDYEPGANGGMFVYGGNLYWIFGSCSGGAILSAPVSGAGPITTIASGLFQPVAMVTDGTYIYFDTANGVSDTVYKVKLTGGAVTALAPAGSAKYAYGLAIDGTYAYIDDANNNRIAKVPLAGGTMTTVVGTSNGFTFAYSPVVTDRTFLYWSQYDYGASKYGIVRAAVTGGGVTVYANTELDANNPGAMLLDGAALYWTDPSAPGSVNKLELCNGQMIQLATAQGHPAYLQESGGTTLWWFDQENSTQNVFNVPK